MEWARLLPIRGEWTEAVQRSLITLKALTTRRPAASSRHRPPLCPSSSVGPQLGLSFCWLRDATLTLLALMYAGFEDEAQ